MTMMLMMEGTGWMQWISDNVGQGDACQKRSIYYSLFFVLPM